MGMKKRTNILFMLPLSTASADLFQQVVINIRLAQREVMVAMNVFLGISEHRCELGLSWPTLTLTVFDRTYKGAATL